MLLGSSLTRTTLADSCSSAGGFSTCFDANALWLPPGKAELVTLPDTRVNTPGQLSAGFAAELLRGSVSAHVASPDSAGRDIRIVDYAFDASVFLTVGVFRNLETSLTLPTRLYQNGAGAGGITSQSAPAITASAIRDPRLGVAYSLDSLVGRPALLGLRGALDVSLPLGDSAAFAGERSLVAMPTVTLGSQLSAVVLRASVGARIRRSVDFGDVRLGSEGYVALGAGVDVLAPGLLFLSVEGFVLPPLGSSRAAAASASVTGVSLVPAEWLLRPGLAYPSRVKPRVPRPVAAPPIFWD
jgi:hypothetical protein